MNYLQFLRLLLGFRDKLPALIAQVQVIVAAVKAIMALVSPDEPAPGELAVTETTQEEAEAEAEVAALVAGPTAAFDGSRLRGIFTFLKDSGLLEILTTLLKTKLAGI